MAARTTSTGFYHPSLFLWWWWWWRLRQGSLCAIGWPETCCVERTKPELTEIPLLLPPQDWGERCAPPCPVDRLSRAMYTQDSMNLLQISFYWLYLSPPVSNIISELWILCIQCFNTFQLYDTYIVQKWSCVLSQGSARCGYVSVLGTSCSSLAIHFPDPDSLTIYSLVFLILLTEALIRNQNIGMDIFSFLGSVSRALHRQI